MKKRAWIWTVATLMVVLAGVLLWRMLTSQNNVPLDLAKREKPVQLFMNSTQAPPTNKWFSSLAFKFPSEPVYAYPLAFKTTAQGMAFSYPRITASADTVAASFTPDIEIDFGQTVTAYITQYDDLSVVLEIKNGDKKLASLRATQGSPYIFTTLEPGVRVATSRAFVAENNGNYVAESNGRRHGVYAEPQIQQEGPTLTNTGASAQLAFYAFPDGGGEVIREGARHPITSTHVQYKTVGNKVETTFEITTKDGKPTPFALLPSQQPPISTMHYTTLLGEQSIAAINRHTFTLPLAEISSELPLSNLKEDERQKLRAVVANEAKTVTFTKNDSYFSGKEFYKIANMLQLASQLNMHDEKEMLRSGLRQGLEKWLQLGQAGEADGTYFYYDKALKGIVGLPASFGSEEFNDHHFHYGYFIYASALLARYDTEFLQNNAPIVTALVSDIAGTNRDGAFPYLRVFDQYVGHSWASGFAPFADGNNQESSSEAVNAWAAVGLWARVANDTSLAGTANWLYAREAQAAKEYYLNLNTNRPELKGYNHSIATLLWGGKFDYATFFDASPEAKLAIQLLPMNPSASYLYDDKARVRQNYDAMVRERGNSPVKFKDYLAMYQAAFDQPTALKTAESLSEDDIDGANSRSYMLAWILSQQ